MKRNQEPIPAPTRQDLIDALFDGSRLYDDGVVPLEFGHVGSFRGSTHKYRTPIPRASPTGIPLAPRRTVLVDTDTNVSPTAGIGSPPLITATPRVKFIPPEDGDESPPQLKFVPPELMKETPKPIEPVEEVGSIISECPTRPSYPVDVESLYAALRYTSNVPYGGNICDLYKTTNPMLKSSILTLDFEFLLHDGTGWTHNRDYQLAYTDWGPSTEVKVGILLLHDLLDTRLSWLNFQTAIHPFVRTIAPDLLGFGESSLPRQRRDGKPIGWSPRFHAKIMADFVKTIFPGTPFYVCGLGYSSQIALEMSVMNIPQMKGAILLNPVGFETHRKSIVPPIYYPLLEMANTSDEILASSTPGVATIIQQIYHQTKSHTDPSSQEANSAAIIQKSILSQTTLHKQQIIIQHIASLLANSEMNLPRCRSNERGIDSESVTNPIQIIASKEDQMTQQSQIRVYPYVFNHSAVSIECRSDIGHFAQLEHPEIIAEIVIGFVSSNSGLGSLSEAFIGFRGPFKGNERSLLELLNGFPTK